MCDPYATNDDRLHVPHVFISYARADGRTNAHRVYDALVHKGIRAWLDERDIAPYHDFSAALESAIETASHVIVCITPLSKTIDSFVRREIQYAILLKKPIIPLRFADIPPHITISTAMAYLRLCLLV